MQSQRGNAQEYYDRHSSEYVDKWRSIDADPAGVYRRHTMKQLLDVAGVREGSRVAELGAGTGLVLRELLDRTRPVVGTDVSRGMLERARETLVPPYKVEVVDALPADPWNGEADVWLLQDDVLALSLPAADWDAIVAMEVFRYVRDLDSAFRNVASIMGDQTVFAFTITNLWSLGLFPLKYELRRRLGKVDEERELLQFFVTEGSLRRVLDRAGLRVRELRRLHAVAFNPVARKLVRTAAGAGRVVELDRRLERVPVANRAFDTLLVAAERR
jgi:predicted TPR repeat methyltransferase